MRRMGFGLIGAALHLLGMSAGFARVAPPMLVDMPGRARPPSRSNRRNWLARGSSHIHPHSNTRQRARYRRQIDAGQLSFMPITPTNHPGKSFTREGGIR